MRLVTRNELDGLLNAEEVIEAVYQAFIAHARGKTLVPSPTQLMFHADGALAGDCHVKSAAIEGFEHFSIKVATGFYRNPKLGLPVNDGLILMMSRETGQVVAVIDDGGQLTSWRTAAAGAVAARLKPLSAPGTLGIVGTGHQAEMQARWIFKSSRIGEILIYGRNAANADALVATLRNDGLPTRRVQSVKSLCQLCDIVVTATPATDPVIRSEDVDDKPLLLIALGADSPGKNEVAPELLGRASAIITDDHMQCLDHGDFGNAVRAGTASAQADISLGQVLAGDLPNPAMLDRLIVVDLTGLGVQDLAIASLFWSKLSARD